MIPKWQPKKKLILRAKDLYKKKLYFKKFLVKYYIFRRVHQLRNLYNLVQKKSGNKVINFLMHLESQLSSICLRMHFFWNLYKARLWIHNGTVYVNGKCILFSKYLVKVNDLVTLLLKVSKKKKYISRMFIIKKFHSKKYKSLNCSEINYKCMSGILFFLPYNLENLQVTLKKKRKHWVKTRVFTSFVNSFS